MAEEVADTTQTTEELKTQELENMELETVLPDETVTGEPAVDLPDIVEKPSENCCPKRAREEEKDDDGEDKQDTKKPTLDKSLEEERLEVLETKEIDGDDHKDEEVKEIAKVDEVKDVEMEPSAKNVGPKMFCSSVDMFEYFYKLLHRWPINLDINKYEHLVLLDLLMKGHADSVKKIGAGIQAFQVRFHPTWKSRCFFLVRIDGSADDFSFRKCVDSILPLPDNMKAPSASSNGKKGGGQPKGRGRGRGHGRGGNRGR